jgi:hypothetical protein
MRTRTRPSPCLRSRTGRSSGIRAIRTAHKHQFGMNLCIQAGDQSAEHTGGYWQTGMPSGGTDRDGQDAEFGRASGTGSLQWLCALLFSGHGRPSRMHCLDPGQVISASRGHPG